MTEQEHPSRFKRGAEMDHVLFTLVHTLESHLTDLTKEVQATRNGVRLHGCEARPVPTGATGATISTVPGRWMGHMLHETSGVNPASVAIFDGSTADGTLIGTVDLAASESARDFFGPQGIGLTAGMWLSITGTVAGSIFYTGA